jgi:hypothetical protein
MKKITKIIGCACIIYSAYHIIYYKQTPNMNDVEVIHSAAMLAELKVLEVGCIGLMLLLGSFVFNLIKK